MRKPRILEQGARYHVIAKANRAEHIFSSYKIKDMFLDVLQRAKGRYSFALSTFCIMGNHVHLIITPAMDENLSRIMQWILSVFAIAYNKEYSLIGHVWYDRFKSFILGNLTHFLRTFQYISQNPVEAGIVKQAKDYKFSGLWHLYRKKYDLIDPAGIKLKKFGFS